MSKIFIFLTFSVCFGGFLLSQVKPVILSSKVGEQIDSHEREKYGIINLNFTDFKSAVFYRTSDRKYSLKISYLDSDKNPKDSVLDVDEMTVFNAAFRVEFYEAVSEGISPANHKFSLDSSGNSYIVRIDKGYPELLPFVLSGKKIMRPNPTVGFGASVSYVFVNLEPVKNFFEQVENYFRQQGWDIPRNKLKLGGLSMYSFNFYIHVFNTIGIDLETGRSMDPDIDLWYSAGYLQYNLNLDKLGGLKPFTALGLGKYSYYVENYYNAKVDPGGAYLEKITSSGSSVGLFLKTGFEAGPASGGKFLPFCVNVYAVYSYFPKIETENYGFKTSVKLGGFRFGAGLRIYI